MINDSSHNKLSTDQDHVIICDPSRKKGAKSL